MLSNLLALLFLLKLGKEIVVTASLLLCYSFIIVDYITIIALQQAVYSSCNKRPKNKTSGLEIGVNEQIKLFNKKIK